MREVQMGSPDRRLTLLPILRAQAWHWVFPVLVVVAATIVVVLAPAERTLGQAIRIVYVHVALTWTGLFGIGLGAVLGVLVLLTNRPALARWRTAVGDVALAFFGLSVLSSMLAAQLTWGAVFWSEPRMQAALSVIAVGVILRVIAAWAATPRFGALAQIALAAFVALYLPRTPLVLHPGRAALTTPSAAIAATFVVLWTFSMALAAWIAWVVAQRRGRSPSVLGGTHASHG